MKKMNLKALAVVLTFALAMATFVGCGSEPAEDASESVNVDAEVNNEADDNATSGGVSFQPSAATTQYTLADLEGTWVGSTSLVNVTGAEEMQKYLEEIYGRSLTDAEIAGLSTATATEDYAEMELYTYWDEETAKEYPGSWQITMDMGDFFGEQVWDDWDMLTYDEFMNDQRANGCVVLDNNNYFQLDVTEKDEIGEYGSAFFQVSDSVVAGDGEYGMVFAGQAVDGTDGDADIVGEFAIMFQYGDMSEPYVMYYTISFTECYPYQ